jgi:hypothetical protein
LLQSIRIHVIPIGGRLEVEVIALGHCLEKWDCLHGEVHVVLFDVSGVKSENMEGPTLGECGSSSASQKREQDKGTKATDHAGTFPGVAERRDRFDRRLSND